MNTKSSNKIFSILIATIVILVLYIIFVNNKSIGKPIVIVSPAPIVVGGHSLSESEQSNNGAKTFVFDNFHGSKDISKKFHFIYPDSWYNDAQYFSPQKVEYYDLYSVKAPFYFDLILASIFDQTDFKNQIDTSKRKSPDSHGKINGEEFKRYDLIDGGSYGGESAGRVIIYVGPTITVNGLDYYLVFHWEEKPLTVVIPGNNPNIFENVVSSIKFIE